jgi:pyrroline-5-carboxylate reductase
MTSPDLNPDRAPVLAFIGGGNMARSLIAGLRAQGHRAQALRVADPSATATAALAKDFGVTIARDNAEAVTGADLVLLAVKPQVMADVCTGLAPYLPTGIPVVSIAAGIRSGQIDAWLGGQRAVIRAMPNTPALLQAGATGLFGNRLCTDRQRALAQHLMDAVGVTVWIDDEDLMDAVTAVSGSGPAYVFRLIEAMQAAAVAQGLPADSARTLVLHTVFGAARMALETGEDATTLRQRVTSPGGTTAAAMAAFDDSGFNAGVEQAIDAATRRGAELSRPADSNP